MTRGRSWGFFAAHLILSRVRRGCPTFQIFMSRHACGGITVAESVHGTQTTVPDTVQLAAYRVIQEALTNVGKHSTGARCPTFCRIINRRRCESRYATSAPRMAWLRRIIRLHGSGLAGMQERVRAAGRDARRVSVV